MSAGVVKQVDALDSKSSGACSMRVRFPPPAPKATSTDCGLFIWIVLSRYLKINVTETVRGFDFY